MNFLFFQRTATVTVTGGGITRTISITQPQPGSTNELDVSSTSWTAPPAGGGTSIGVSANVGWSASSNQGWLTVSPTSGSGNGAINLNATPNGGSSQRTATVTVTGGGITRTISVTQPTSGTSNELNVSSSSWLAPPTGGITVIGIFANVPWSASSNQSWLTVTPASGNSNGSISLNAAPNGGPNQRTAAVTVFGGGITRTINVTQTGTVFNISPLTISPPPSGGAFPITIESNVPWSATTNASWITINPQSGGPGTTVVMVTIAPNTTGMSRTGQIFFNASGISRMISVAQQ